MANTLKTGKTYDPNTTGDTYVSTVTYMIVSHFIEFNSRNKAVTFMIEIYKSKTRKDANADQVLKIEHTVSTTDFDTYFKDDVLDPLGKTPLSQCYVYLSTEQPTISTITWADWESDD